MDYSSTMDSRISGARNAQKKNSLGAAKSEEGAAAAKIEVRPMAEIKDDPPDPNFNGVRAKYAAIFWLESSTSCSRSSCRKIRRRHA